MLLASERRAILSAARKKMRRLRRAAVDLRYRIRLAGTGPENPHQINAALIYTQAHPDICRADPPVVLENGMTLEQCQSQAMLQVMPGWMTEHPDRV